jgi:hypothetical protein
VSIILALLALDEDQVARDTFVDGVGALLRSRTQERGTGREAGTFTENTRPTYDQVLELMDQAAKDIDGEVGADTLDFPRADQIKPLADSVLKLGTAMLIELSYFNGEVASGRSAYDRYERLYNRRLPQLRKAALEVSSGSQPGSSDDYVGPLYSFPAAPCDTADAVASDAEVPLCRRRWYPPGW